MTQIMTILLGMSYSISWTIPMADGNQYQNVVFLALISSIITFPYFLIEVLKGISENAIPSLIVIFIGIFCPPALILLPLIQMLGLFKKFKGLAHNLPLIFWGIALYSALLVAPNAIRHSSSLWIGININLPFFTILLLAVIGSLLFCLSVYGISKYQQNPCSAVMVMLGFPSYLILFLITFLLPGIGENFM
jgi:hypothetical protein